MSKPAFPDGHFYSPVVDTVEAARDEAVIWPPALQPGPLAHMLKSPPTEPTVHGIDWNPASHEDLLRHQFPRLIDGYDYPENGSPDTDVDRFYEINGQFDLTDARVLFCMLRMIRPRRIIEVGSGYSTLLMTDVNDRFLGGEVSITCVEPYPRPFMQRLHQGGAIALMEQRAQDVPNQLFESLQKGDILFIDSSHVSKTGSDVNRLMLDVLPSLNSGVYVHVHDIFFPTDYPKSWVIQHGFSWNEQYVLQALLTDSDRFRVVYGNVLARTFHRESLVAFFNHVMNGASFWMVRT